MILHQILALVSGWTPDSIKLFETPRLFISNGSGKRKKARKAKRQAQGTPRNTDRKCKLLRRLKTTC